MTIDSRSDIASVTFGRADEARGAYETRINLSTGKLNGLIRRAGGASGAQIGRAKGVSLQIIHPNAPLTS
jgi:hypothetical protein